MKFLKTVLQLPNRETLMFRRKNFTIIRVEWISNVNYYTNANLSIILNYWTQPALFRLGLQNYCKAVAIPSWHYDGLFLWGNSIKDPWESMYKYWNQL